MGEVGLCDIWLMALIGRKDIAHRFLVPGSAMEEQRQVGAASRRL